MSRKVLTDTSLLMYCISNKRDLVDMILEVLEEVSTIVIPPEVIFELEILSQSKCRKARYASLALDYIEILSKKYSSLVYIKEENTENVSNVDESLINRALKEDALIATADKELKSRAIARGINVLFLVKAKKKLRRF